MVNHRRGLPCTLFHDGLNVVRDEVDCRHRVRDTLDPIWDFVQVSRRVGFQQIAYFTPVGGHLGDNPYHPNDSCWGQRPDRGANSRITGR